VAAAYLAVTSVPLAAGGVSGARGLALVLHLGALALIAGAEQARRSGSTAGWATLVSELNLLVLIPALYAELPLLMDGLPGAVVYHDPAVQALDAAWFGYQPAWELAGRLPNRWVSEVLHLAYLLYYPIIYVPPLLLYTARGARTPPRNPVASGSDGWREGSDARGTGSERRRSGADAKKPGRPLGPTNELESELAFDRALLALSLSMLSCYLIFVVFPVQGPRYIGPPEGIPEGPIRALVLTILQGGSSRGAAFPSSHVAVAVTQSLVMLRFHRPAGMVMTVTSLLLAAGAVYGGFHYAIDALTGGVVGVAAWLVSGAVQRARERAEPGFALARRPV
jgi:hypothetical protein